MERVERGVAGKKNNKEGREEKTSNSEGEDRVCLGLVGIWAAS